MLLLLRPAAGVVCRVGRAEPEMVSRCFSERLPRDLEEGLVARPAGPPRARGRTHRFFSSARCDRRLFGPTRKTTRRTKRNACASIRCFISRLWDPPQCDRARNVHPISHLAAGFVVSGVARRSDDAPVLPVRGRGTRLPTPSRPGRTGGRRVRCSDPIPDAASQMSGSDATAYSVGKSSSRRGRSSMRSPVRTGWSSKGTKPL